jgi:hypothetical protein
LGVFLFWKIAQKAVRDCDRKSPSAPNFFSKFFFTTTWRLLRSGRSRSVRETLRDGQGLSPFRAVRNPCRLVDEQVAPQAKNGRWV